MTQSTDAKRHWRRRRHRSGQKRPVVTDRFRPLALEIHETPDNRTGKASTDGTWPIPMPAFGAASFA